MSSQEVQVFTAQGDFEAEQVCAFLEAHGVATMVRGEAMRKTHGLTLDGLGEVRVLVPAEQEATARDLLERVEQGDLMLAPDQEP